MADTAVADAAVETTAADDAVAASAETVAAEAPAAATATLITDTTDASADTPASVVPDKYDLKLPDNSMLVETDIEELAAKARSQGLNNDQAQAQLEYVNERVAKEIVALNESVKPGGAAWAEAVEALTAQAKADPTLHPSPEAFQANIETAKNVLNQYGGTVADNKPLYDALEETGYGSHPAFLKFLLNVAKATSEGKVVPGGSVPAKVGTSPRDVYDHPDNYKQQESTT